MTAVFIEGCKSPVGPEAQWWHVSDPRVGRQTSDSLICIVGLDTVIIIMCPFLLPMVDAYYVEDQEYDFFG